MIQVSIVVNRLLRHWMLLLFYIKMVAWMIQALGGNQDTFRTICTYFKVQYKCQPKYTNKKLFCRIFHGIFIVVKAVTYCPCLYGSRIFYGIYSYEGVTYAPTDSPYFNDNGVTDNGVTLFRENEAYTIKQLLMFLIIN